MTLLKIYWTDRKDTIFLCLQIWLGFFFTSGQLLPAVLAGLSTVAYFLLTFNHKRNTND